MERFCGKLQRAVKGRRFVWACIDNWVLRTAQALHVRFRYNLTLADIQFAPPPSPRVTALNAPCKSSSRPRCCLCAHSCADENYSLTGSAMGITGDDCERNGRALFGRLAGALRTRLGMDIPLKTIKAALRTINLWSWAGVAVHDGDTISADSRASDAADQRDKTFLRVRIRRLPRLCPSLTSDSMTRLSTFVRAKQMRLKSSSNGRSTAGSSTSSHSRYLRRRLCTWTLRSPSSLSTSRQSTLSRIRHTFRLPSITSGATKAKVTCSTSALYSA
jgi:hypothetical protein